MFALRGETTEKPYLKVMPGAVASGLMSAFASFDETNFARAGRKTRWLYTYGFTSLNLNIMPVAQSPGFDGTVTAVDTADSRWSRDGHAETIIRG
jgi:hypothetical protein